MLTINTSACVVFYDWRQTRNSGNEKLAYKYAQKLERLQKEAGKYAVANDYGARFTQAGGVGLNASTSHDATRYHVSLPSNKLELWFALEAERFQVVFPSAVHDEEAISMLFSGSQQANLMQSLWQLDICCQALKLCTQYQET